MSGHIIAVDTYGAQRITDPRTQDVDFERANDVHNPRHASKGLRRRSSVSLALTGKGLKASAIDADRSFEVAC